MTTQDTTRRSITVGANESIYQIARRELGSAGLWRELINFNGVNVFDAATPGAQLNIPTADEVQQITAALADPVGTLSQLATTTISKTLPTNISRELLDLSKVKQPATGDYSLISWLF